VMVEVLRVCFKLLDAVASDPPLAGSRRGAGGMEGGGEVDGEAEVEVEEKAHARAHARLRPSGGGRSSRSSSPSSNPSPSTAVISSDYLLIPRLASIGRAVLLHGLAPTPSPSPQQGEGDSVDSTAPGASAVQLPPVLRTSPRWAAPLPSDSGATPGASGHLELSDSYDRQPLDEDDACTICAGDPLPRSGQGVVNLPCAHRFHRTCVAALRKRLVESPCPSCSPEHAPPPWDDASHTHVYVSLVCSACACVRAYVCVGACGGGGGDGVGSVDCGVGSSGRMLGMQSKRTIHPFTRLIRTTAKRCTG
jgi:hypothetical protein